MPNVSHVDLTEPNLHEPKGASTAAAGKVYVADGAASGAWAYPGGAVYGGIASKDGAIAIDTIGTTAKKLEVFTANEASNLTTPDHTNDQITVTVAGDYLVALQITLATATAGDAGEYQVHLRVNGIEDATMGARQHMSGSNDVESITCQGIVTLAASDILTVYIESDDAGTDDIVVNAANLTVVLLKAA